MFDKNTYPAKLIQTKLAMDNVKNQWFEEVQKLNNADDIEGYSRIKKKYTDKIIKAEKAFAKEHDKYCDQINAPQMKITENWSKYWK